MEGSFGGGGDDGIGKNGGPSDGRPPNPFAGASRQFMGGAHGESPCKSALGRHDSLVAVPGALFEDKPQSANDTWRKLHSDPLLLIRQREQEALARIKNNPIKMAMIKKSVEDEKKKKQDKKEKKRHKDHHHSRSKDDKRSLRRYSDSEFNTFLSWDMHVHGTCLQLERLGRGLGRQVANRESIGVTRGLGYACDAHVEWNCKARND
ncbi:uncharacterized protein LOC135679666 isoform X3 [Musa acuminata AAA Group]|uniref:uncharacterized protein LOC135679666 isoform X3 n=1 Tax=Musa acuminata AAA Group TaxID=214697 RepID=UPI0031CFD32A